jgi:hypothetical protein
MLFCAVGIGYLVLFVVSSNKILENSTAFKDPNLLAVVVFISESWNPTVGVDSKEPGFFLLVLGEV